MKISANEVHFEVNYGIRSSNIHGQTEITDPDIEATTLIQPFYFHSHMIIAFLGQFSAHSPIVA